MLLGYYNIDIFRKPVYDPITFRKGGTSYENSYIFGVFVLEDLLSIGDAAIIWIKTLKLPPAMHGPLEGIVLQIPASFSLSLAEGDWIRAFRNFRKIISPFF